MRRALNVTDFLVSDFFSSKGGDGKTIKRGTLGALSSLGPIGSIAAMSVAASSVMKAANRKSKGPLVEFVKEGTLLKLGSNRKTWKPRWFVLTSSELVFFNSGAESVW